MKAKSDSHTSRVEKLRSRLQEMSLDAFLVTFQPHLRYLSGFSGSAAYGIVTRASSHIVTDGRYKEQIKEEVVGWTIAVAGDSLMDEIKKRRLFRPGLRVGFDGNSIMYHQFRRLKQLFPKVNFLPKADFIEKIARVKDASEICSIRRAVEISDNVFSEILPYIKPGVAETDIAAEISYRHRKYGADGDGFQPIVASGYRSALPHGRASDKKLKNGDIVTLDFGCVFQGYHSDLTRTVIIGRPKPPSKKIYGIVLEAQMNAIEGAKAGVKASEVDALARSVIRSAGYDKYFKHSLGHGIGLQIHEQPRLSMFSKAVLEAGNTVTIEPGIYIPDFGGVRIEDDVVITGKSCEVLNRSPKELLII